MWFASQVSMFQPRFALRWIEEAGFMEKRESQTESLGERVRRIRRERNWTQDKLAAEATVSKSFISEVESGTSQPRGPLLVRLAMALGASLDYLMTGREPSPSRPSTPVEIPRELAMVAERQHLPFSHVALLLEFRDSLEARRRDQPPQTLSESDWEEFYKDVRPQIEKVLGPTPQ
jgi:transcriptional regulator with XRE-family HTH domain